MFNLKSAYLYFLAIKIFFLKSIKKIYFTTSYYNKSLQSKKPSDFYFFPNPFLLSSFTNNRNFSFKVSNIDSDMFWKDKSSIKDKKNLNSFLWLNLIDRKNDAKIIQKIITIWIYKNDKYKSVIWSSSILSTRITSWILNAEIILRARDYKESLEKLETAKTNLETNQAVLDGSEYGYTTSVDAQNQLEVDKQFIKTAEQNVKNRIVEDNPGVIEGSINLIIR